MPMNLEVPIEMLDYGAGIAFNNAATTLIRSSISLNPSDYDGATFFFEMVANAGLTGGASPTASVSLMQGATTKATVAVAGNAGNTVCYRSSSFVPTAGANTYQVKLSVTGSPTGGSANIWQCRIIVVQKNATLTRIQIPMLAFDWTGAVITETAIDSTTAAGPTQTAAQYYRQLLLELGNFVTISNTNPYTLEAVLKNSGSNAAWNGFVELVDSSANVVTNSKVSTPFTNTTEQLLTTNFSSDTNWVDGRTYTLKIGSSNVSNTISLYRAALYIRLTSVSRAQVHIRISKRNSTAASGNQDTNQYNFTTNNYNFYGAFYEVTALLSAGVGATTDDLLDNTAAGSVLGSSISVSSGTRSQLRSSLLNTIPSGDNMRNEYTVGASTTLDVQGGYLIVNTYDTNPSKIIEFNQAINRSFNY